MVVISKREKEIINEKMPYVHIRRTVKSKSGRHKYYMEEDKDAMNLLKNMYKSM